MTTIKQASRLAGRLAWRLSIPYRIYLHSAMIPERGRFGGGEGAAQRPQKRKRGAAPAAHFSIIALGDTLASLTLLGLRRERELSLLSLYATLLGGGLFYHRCKRYRFKTAMQKTKPLRVREMLWIKQCKRVDYFTINTLWHNYDSKLIIKRC